MSARQKRFETVFDGERYVRFPNNEVSARQLGEYVLEESKAMVRSATDRKRRRKKRTKPGRKRKAKTEELSLSHTDLIAGMQRRVRSHIQHIHRHEHLLRSYLETSATAKGQREKLLPHRILADARLRIVRRKMKIAAEVEQL